MPEGNAGGDLTPGNRRPRVSAFEGLGTTAKLRLREQFRMGDKKFTLFELHFDGPLSLGPSFGSDPEPDVESTTDDVPAPTDGGASTTTSTATEDDGGAPVKGAILGVLAIVALAVAARVLFGGDDVDEPELVDLEEVPDAEEVTDDVDGTVEDD